MTCTKAHLLVLYYLCPVPVIFSHLFHLTHFDCFQLSAISQYADEMFGDIFNEASKYVYRSSRLESRVQNLAHLVEQKRSDQIGKTRFMTRIFLSKSFK